MSTSSGCSRASKGEWQADAVRGEAWLLAFDIGQKLGRPLDLERDDDASLLVRWLYNHCVKYCETVVRRAVRLDHAAEDDEDGQPHWLMGRLTADEGHHPLSLLEAAESARAEPDAPDAYHSSAAAWLQLLQRFDRRMPDVAAYLMISLSWCYACCRHAHDLARAQWPLPHGLSIEEAQLLDLPIPTGIGTAVAVVDTDGAIALRDITAVTTPMTQTAP